MRKMRVFYKKSAFYLVDSKKSYTFALAFET